MARKYVNHPLDNYASLIELLRGLLETAEWIERMPHLGTITSVTVNIGPKPSALVVCAVDGE